MNSEHTKQRLKRWRESETGKQTIRRWNLANRERLNAYYRKRYHENIEYERERNNDKNRRLKRLVLSAYGNKCVCCGESRPEFLTIDHIEGRKKWGHSSTFGGANIHRWLKLRGFPKDGFRILCFNCNCSRGFLGYCPHEKEREVAA